MFKGVGRMQDTRIDEKSDVVVHFSVTLSKTSSFFH